MELNTCLWVNDVSVDAGKRRRREKKNLATHDYE